MNKKLATLIIVLTFIMGLTQSALAAFDDFHLIRVISDKSPGSILEIATDLGDVRTLASLPANSIVGGGGDAFTNFNTNPVAGLSVNYYAVYRTTVINGTMYIGANTATAPTTGGVGGIQNKLSINATLKSVNKYYSGLPVESGSSATVIANSSDVSSFSGIFGSTTLGSYAGYTGLWATNANLSLTNVDTAPIGMTVWRFGLETGSLMSSPFIGVKVLSLTTNADGSTTINPAAAAKTDQTTPVTVIAVANATYGQTGLAAIASGGNGTGAYSYSAGASTACAVDAASGALTITSGTGTCAITATRAEDATFNVSAASAPALITVGKADQTTAVAVFAVTGATYGQPGLSAIASGGDSSGAYTYSAGASTACSVNAASGDITIRSGSGSCVLTAFRAADNNYNASPASAPATVIVSPATLTVSAVNTSRMFNTKNPVFSPAITGFVNGETTSVLIGTPVLSTTALVDSPVGTYPIKPVIGSLAAANYNFSFTNGTLTITPISLAQNQVLLLGDQSYASMLAALQTINSSSLDYQILIADTYSTPLPEILTFNSGFSVTLNGGLDVNGNPTNNYSVLRGRVNVMSGKLIASKIAIR
jgi:hypothetical protein